MLAELPSNVPELQERWVVVEDNFRVWTGSMGGSSQRVRPPILVLHGGPGLGHDYLCGLTALACDEQQIVFYDQLGCGRSDQPDDPGRWKIDRFVREVDLVRQALQLDEVVLLGQSWGGMLAIEYMVKCASSGRDNHGVRGLILSNALSSAPLMASELSRLRAELPASLRETLDRHEAQGTTDSAEYRQAVAAFYSRHILRMDPLPDMILQAIGEVGQVYKTMWGINEFSVTGNLKDWDRTAQLDQIDVPTLLISGQYDESTPQINQQMLSRLTRARWTMMSGCSHLCHIEQPDAYLTLISTFLDQITGP